MSIAHDLYADTNPAFCAFVVSAFTGAYLSENAAGPTLPLVYLALPIALSGELFNTFAGTNRRTGLLEWLERNPQVQVSLSERLNASLEITTDAIRLSCFTKLISLTSEGNLQKGSLKVKKNVTSGLEESILLPIKHGARLGHWFAMAGTARNVFASLGIDP